MIAVMPETSETAGSVNKTQNSKAHVLLIEDNSGDVRLMQEAFRQNKISADLNVAGDGVEALSFLQRQGPYKNAPRPDLILLDLNLPKKDGRELLAEIKKDELLKRIPVVVLTTSRAEQDVMISYNLHANCFITKPTGFQQLVEVVRSIKEFWLYRVKLPPK
jgi:two-component system, chemotaxis family, response regulator Rcp1